MPKVKAGNKVKIQYLAKLADGTEIDASLANEPFEFEIGASNILPELTNTVLEMEIGETRILQIPPEKAYGAYDESLVVELPVESLPTDFKVQAGEYIHYETENRELKRVLVKSMDDVFLYLDYNHPLAGKALQFEIKLIEVK